MAMDVDEDEDGTQRSKQVLDYGIQVDMGSAMMILLPHQVAMSPHKSESPRQGVRKCLPSSLLA